MQAIIYPRLVVALKVRSRLFTFHESAYAKLFDAIHALTGSASIARLGGAEAIEYRRKVREENAARPVVREGEAGESAAEGKEEEKEPLLAEEKAAGEAEGSAEPATPSLPPPPQLLEPVKSFLSTLREEVKSASPSALSSSSAHSSSNPSNLVQPQGTLMRSLVTFNEYLDSEIYSASTFHTYRPYGAYGSTGTSTATGERKALQEVTHNFKAEIRSLKGTKGSFAFHSACSSTHTCSHQAHCSTDGTLRSREPKLRPLPEDAALSSPSLAFPSFIVSRVVTRQEAMHQVLARAGRRFGRVCRSHLSFGSSTSRYDDFAG